MCQIGAFLSSSLVSGSRLYKGLRICPNPFWTIQGDEPRIATTMTLKRSDRKAPELDSSIVTITCIQITNIKIIEKVKQNQE